MRIICRIILSSALLIFLSCTQVSNSSDDSADYGKSEEYGVAETYSVETPLESYSTSSASTVHGGNHYRDEVDEMYDGVADQTKADLRDACREAGVNYHEMFDDAEIDRQVEELKTETREMMQQYDF